NDDVHVRNNTNPQIAEFPLGDASKPFNNLSFHIQPSSDKNYAGAHVLNSAYEFGVYSAQLGIADMPGGLNVSVNKSGTTAGSAAMLNKGGWVETSLWNCTLESNWGTAFIILGFDITLALEEGLIFYPLPDITFPPNFFSHTSAVIQQLIYHEFAHAQHYGVVGEPYWRKYRKHIVANGAYGGTVDTNGNITFENFENCNHPGQVALGETWADHIEHVFANKKYSSVGFLGILEGEYTGDLFIPYGLFYDMIDANNSTSNGESSYIGTYDQVAGYTEGDIFNTLSSATSPEEVINILANPSNLPTGVSSSDVYVLFQQY
ncbi:MAG: hypothetical protein KDD49_12915, partial [Bacteroidetes bacterium]|nr:hypothetical protein [Bacteroidota bacterium]